MPHLNLPKVALKTKSVEGTIQVFGQVRKKYFVLTPEEWVRQHFIYYLNKEKNYPMGLMEVEKMIKYNSMQTRADIVLYILQKRTVNGFKHANISQKQVHARTWSAGKFVTAYPACVHTNERKSCYI